MTFHVKHPLAFLDAALSELDTRGLLRAPSAPVRPDAESFCSNDYLGLARLPAPEAPSGSGASRLIAGERSEHQALETELADFFGMEAALLFTSGYAANVGALSALLGPEDLVVSDALNHASLIDGMRLAKVSPVVVPHVDVAAVDAALAAGAARARRSWVVVESYYSMDGDGPDLGALRRVCDAHGAALVVDEAHAFGVLGPAGRGLAAAVGMRPDVLVGTLGKALGAQGAFVAGTTALRAWLWNRARSFVFSTGLAPVMAAAGRRGLAVVREDDGRRAHVLRIANEVRDAIVAAGAAPVEHLPADAPERARETPLLVGHGHVVPVVVGTETRAMALADALTAAGVTVRAVRPPTVPEGTSRVRLTVTAAHGADVVGKVAAAFADALPRLRDVR